VTARFKRTVLATVCVPWRDDWTFDEQLFRETTAALLKAGLRDLYVFGTAGEGHSVSERQFDQVAAAFVAEVAAAGEAPMIGVMSPSLPTVLDRIERAAALGARAFQLTLPPWGPLTEAEALRFFDEVCGRFPALQFMHYNIARSGVVLNGRQYARIAAAHANLVAVKYGAGSPEVVHSLLRRAPELRVFLTEPAFAAGCMVGEPGLLASISVTNPARARELFEAGAKGDAARAAELHAELAVILDEARALIGARGAHIDGAFDKVFAKVADPRFPLRLLPPYESADDEAFAAYAAFLAARFPAWLT
jgi:dihydrodipicolinate synthase/N-acetylneuraminate lyase